VLEGRARARRCAGGAASTATRISARGARISEQLGGNCSGETIVNGTRTLGGLRFRLYYTGMAIGVLLVPGHGRLARAHLRAGDDAVRGSSRRCSRRPGAISRALARARVSGNWDKLLGGEAVARAGGQAAALAAVGVDREEVPRCSPSTSRKVDAGLGLGYTPFGLTRVDAERTSTARSR
jgi:hypothetical protein